MAFQGSRREADIAPARMSDNEASSEDLDEFTPKRKKPSRACDQCRKKKIRCDSTSPPCPACVSHKLECVFTRVEKPRKAPRRSAQRIDELESRLLRMEAMLLVSRSSTADGSNSTAHTGHSNPVPRVESELANETTPTSSTYPMSGRTVDPILLPTTSVLKTDTIHYLQQTIEPSLANDNESAIAKSGSCVSKRSYTKLPSKSEALPLLKDFFDGFNSVIPLFQPTVLMDSFEQNYMRDRSEDSAWWAILNIVMALSIRLKPSHKDLNSKAREYAQNAFDVIPDLVMKKTDLPAIQALLGMALFLHGSPNPRPASVLIAAAIRLSYGLGMHRKESSIGLLPMEADQRRRVFWLAYCLDKDFSLRFEQPPIINDNDIDVDLPVAEPCDGIGMIYPTGGASPVNYFRLRIHLAVIQSKAYADLYSVRALKLSEEEKLPAVQRLDQCLEDWRNGIPEGLRPNDSPDGLANALSPPCIAHVVVLHLLYFNCLTTVHRVSFQNSRWKKIILREENEHIEDAQHQLCYSALQCNEAARSSMHLMKLAPQGDFAYTWVLISYCVSAISVLLAKVLHRPYHDFAHSDIDLVRPELELLNSLARDHSTEEIERMLAFCNELARRAQNAVQSTSPPSGAQKLTPRGLREHQSAQQPPVYGSQMDTKSAFLADLPSSHTFETAEPAVSHSESWILEPPFDTDFGNVPLDDRWEL